MRTRKTDTSCLHVRRSFLVRKAGRIGPAAPRHEQISCVAARKHEYRAICEWMEQGLDSYGNITRRG